MSGVASKAQGRSVPEADRSPRRTVLNNSAINTVTNFVIAILGYFFHGTLSRLMTVTEFGQLQSLLSLFAMLGWPSYTIGFFVNKHCSAFLAQGQETRLRPFIDYLAGRTGLLTIGLYGAAVAVAAALGVWSRFEALSGAPLVVLAATLTPIISVYQAHVQARHRFDLLSIVCLSSYSAKVCVGFAIACISPLARHVAVSCLIGELLGWGISRYQAARLWNREGYEKGKSEPDLYWQLLRLTAVPITIYSVAFVVVGQSDVFLVRLFSDAQTAGYYGAFSLLSKIVLMGNLSVVSAMLPVFNEAKARRQRPNRSVISGAYALILFSSLSATLIYWVAPDLIISVLFGHKYLAFRDHLWTFGIMALALSLLSLEANYTFSQEDYRVTYVLIVVLMLSAGSIYLLHESIKSIALGLSGAFMLGFLALVVLNSPGSRRRGTS